MTILHDTTLYALWTPEGEPVDCTVYPYHPVCLNDDFTAPGIVNVLDTLPSETITLTFWHVFGASSASVIDQAIDDFEGLYPNIQIKAQSQGSYTDLFSKMKLAIMGGVTPDIFVGYPAHMDQYRQFNAVLPIDDFVVDDLWVTNF